MSSKAKNIIIAGVIFACIGWGVQKCKGNKSNTASDSETKTEQTITVGSNYDCPHCYGTGQRVNNVTGIKGKCSSCGGDGEVTKDQYDRLSK